MTIFRRAWYYFVMGKIIYIPALLIMVCSLAVTSQADIYKFVDDRGVVHFTNIPQGEGYTKIMEEDTPPPRRNFDTIISSSSSKYNIEPAIIKAVITAESNWNPKAISHKGAIGLMQLMPSTARDMEINNPFDPEENIEAGTRYLRHLLNRFNGDLDLALAAYNAGPGTVERSGGIPPIAETHKFVRTVNEIYRGRSDNETVRIYKITYSDGTVLYTNSSISY